MVFVKDDISHSKGAKSIECIAGSNILICVDADDDVLSIVLPFADFFDQIDVNGLSRVGVA